jgi:Putative prokaryotic signal transducing protein
VADLVEVAFVGNEYEPAIIQALLEESGIPSLQERAGLDGSYLSYMFLGPGGGQRRVMVHAHRAEDARALLAEAQADAG